MQPPKPDARKLNELRVTRKTNVEVEVDDGHGWAVSYADLLMVLLSFFVLYFNFSENTVESELQKIAMSMQGLGAKEIEAATRKPDSISSLSEALKIEGVKVTQHEDHLLVELENGAFRAGRFEVGPNLRGEVDKIMERLSPFKEKLALTVIGHADKRPLIRQNEFLQDNFDLSSLRALHVLKHVLGKGFPENRVSARAASSYDRDARSVTFEIRIAQAQKAGGSS